MIAGDPGLPTGTGDIGAGHIGAGRDGGSLEEEAALLAVAAAPEEHAAEAALRPRSLTEFIGQDRVREQLGLVLDAARGRAGTADHVLLSGPPGLGKTTLAVIIAEEMGAPLRVTSGPAVQHAGDLAAVLASLTEGEVLFLDEIHRMARSAEEMLYMAMEDYRVDVIVGKGPGATAIPLEIPPFTLVGATTRAGLLPGPLRDRFGFTAQMDFYGTEELTAVVTRSAHLLGVVVAGDAAQEIAGRSRGTPRIANRLLRRVRDYAQVRAGGKIDQPTAQAALQMLEVDRYGFDEVDRKLLLIIIEKYQGGPVGLNTLAAALAEEPDAIEEIYEPFLIQIGFLNRTPRGRVATQLAYEHFGITPNRRQSSLF